MSPCLYCPKVSASMAMFLTSHSEFLSSVQDYTGVTHPKQQFNSCLTTSLYNFRLDLKACEVCQKSMTNLSGSMAMDQRSSKISWSPSISAKDFCKSCRLTWAQWDRANLPPVCKCGYKMIQVWKNICIYGWTTDGSIGGWIDSMRYINVYVYIFIYIYSISAPGRGSLTSYYQTTLETQIKTSAWWWDKRT